jgi:membrane protein
MKGINRAYGIDFERPWCKRQLLAVGATIGISIVGVGAVVVLLLSSDLARTLGLQLGAERSVVLFWHDLRRPLLVVVLVAGFWVLYRVLPHVRQGWLQALPGALVATAGWLVLAQAFALYLGFSHGISVALASIGLGIVILLWFYFLGVITLLGAEVNAALRTETAAARTAPSGGRASGDTC